jgi:hypothetical protein
VSPLRSFTQASDDEKRLRELFLQSRQQMEIVPSPSLTAKPTPGQAPSPTHEAWSAPTPESTVRGATTLEATRVPRAPARETGTPKSTPISTSRLTSFPTSTPTVTPAESADSPPPQSRKEDITLATPTPKPKKRHGWWIFGRDDEEHNGQIVIQKSRSQEEADTVPAPQGAGLWRYLTPAVRKAIDEARVARNRWKYTIVHNSGTRQGNARIFDYYHRHVRKMPNGLAYHFVIGNGTSSGNGQIEIGNRWVRQLAGGHVHSDYLNYISIGICLVGDFNRDLPTQAQYQALDELIRYLRQRVGKIDGKYSIVLGHKEINPVPTDCPGKRFPLVWLHRTFPD